MEERINKLQDENKQLKLESASCADSSFASDIGKEMSIVHLVEQLTTLNTKYADLKIKSMQDNSNTKLKTSKLVNDLKEAKEQAESMQIKFDTLSSNSQEISDKLRARVKLLEKGKKDAEDQVQEIGELKKQVYLLKNDMMKSEATEKKLKDAIRKKKDELVKEKKIRRTESKNDLSTTKKTVNMKNKLEKDMRNMSSDYTKLKEENKILKSRVSDLIGLNKDTNQNYYVTGVPTSKQNSSFAVPLNAGSYIFGNNYNTLDNRKSLRSHQSTSGIQRKNIDNRAESSKQLPMMSELFQKEATSFYKSPRRSSCSNLTKSSFNFGERKRGESHEKVIGDTDGGSCRYCNACKYKVWRKKLLTYDPLELIKNRDLIKSIQCLACDKNYDVKFFIHHSKNCRLTNGVAAFNDKSNKNITRADIISCDHYENSVSSSPKELEESRISIEKREFLFSPDDDILFNSPRPQLLENEPTPQKIFGTSEISSKKLNMSATKIMTPRKNDRLTQRRMTENSDTMLQRTYLKKKMDLGSETDDTLFNNDDLRRPINTNDLLNTINAIEACESLAYKSNTPNGMSSKPLSRTFKPSQKKSSNKSKLYCKKQIPSLKFVDGVLNSGSRR